jgi:hypothetical protein
MNKGFRIALAPSIEEGTVGRYIAVVIGEQSSIQNMKNLQRREQCQHTFGNANRGTFCKCSTSSVVIWYVNCRCAIESSSVCHGFASAASLIDTAAPQASTRANVHNGSGAGAGMLLAASLVVCSSMRARVAAASHWWRVSQKTCESGVQLAKVLDCARRRCATLWLHRLARTMHSAKEGRVLQLELGALVLLLVVVVVVPGSVGLVVIADMVSERKSVREGCCPVWKSASGIGRRVQIFVEGSRRC